MNKLDFRIRICYTKISVRAILVFDKRRSTMEFLATIINEFRQMLTDWPLGTIMAILLIIVAVFAVGVIVYLTYYAYDSWFLDRLEGQGKVVGKEFTSAHTTYSMLYNANSKTQTMIPIYHSDEWVVFVEINGRDASLSVGEKFFDEVSEGTQVKVGYVKGRLSGNPYIRDLELA